MSWLVSLVVSACCFCRRRAINEPVRPHAETQIIYDGEDTGDNLLRDPEYVSFANRQHGLDSNFVKMTLRWVRSSPRLVTPRWTLFTTLNKMVRVATDCHDVRRTELHPIVVDAWFSLKLSTLGITPRIEILSPPIMLDRSLVGQFNLTMSESRIEECRSRQGSLRFLITESLPGYVPISQAGKMQVRTSLLVGRRLVAVLALVHQNGFIHGNIRPETVWVNEVGNVKLIDFSRAINDGSDRENTGEDIFSMSPWQLGNSQNTLSVRDDLWRGIRLMAILMHGRQIFEEHEKNFLLDDGDTTELLLWKFAGDFFNLPTSNPVLEVVESVLGREQAQSHVEFTLRSLNMIKYEILTTREDETLVGYAHLKAMFDTILPFIPLDTTVNI